MDRHHWSTIVFSSDYWTVSYSYWALITSSSALYSVTYNDEPGALTHDWGPINGLSNYVIDSLYNQEELLLPYSDSRQLRIKWLYEKRVV